MKIAVSYRHADKSATFDQLVQRLIDRYGVENVYVDLKSNQLGEMWAMRSSGAYIAATYVLIVIGPNWNPARLRDQNDIVRLELSASQRFATMVPVLIDGATMPDPKQLPRLFRWLPTTHGYVIDQRQPEESFSAFLDQLTHHASTSAGWMQRVIRPKKIQEVQFDLTGTWQWQSSLQLFDQVFIHQDGLIVNLRGQSPYDDEIAGQGFIGIDAPQVSFLLKSRQFGPAGALILKYCAETDVLAGRFMPPARRLIIAALRRKRVMLVRTKL